MTMNIACTMIVCIEMPYMDCFIVKKSLLIRLSMYVYRWVHMHIVDTILALQD